MSGQFEHYVLEDLRQDEVDCLVGNAWISARLCLCALDTTAQSSSLNLRVVLDAEERLMLHECLAKHSPLMCMCSSLRSHAAESFPKLADLLLELPLVLCLATAVTSTFRQRGTNLQQ